MRLLILKFGKGMEGLKRFTVWFWDLNRREARQERLHAFHVGRADGRVGRKDMGQSFEPLQRVVSLKEVR